MNEQIAPGAYGVLTEPATLTIRRLLPGSVERAWSYLVDGDKRRQWLAVGGLTLQPGAPFSWTWRNDELTSPPGTRPTNFPAEHTMEQRVIAVEPPTLLVIGWGREGEVRFALEPRGDKPLLTLTHSRLPGRPDILNIAGGWHAHLDILVARMAGATPEPFWDYWGSLRKEYERRLPTRARQEDVGHSRVETSPRLDGAPSGVLGRRRHSGAAKPAPRRADVAGCSFPPVATQHGLL